MAKQDKQNWFKQHKVLTGFGIFIILAIIGSAAGGDSNKTSSSDSTGSSTPTASSEAKETVATIGQPASDGKFEFTVSSIECGKASVGANQYLTKTAQGQYCLLSVAVKNTGDQAQSLFSSNQYLLNASGQKYSADDTATMYNTPNGSTWYNDINPGNSVSGVIVFDVPKDQTPVSAELHDSAFSGGVKVNLK